jgi:hypothetical protein
MLILPYNSRDSFSYVVFASGLLRLSARHYSLPQRDAAISGILMKEESFTFSYDKMRGVEEPWK